MVKKNAKETVGQHAALKFTKVNAILGVAGLACMVLGYALLASRARSVLLRPRVVTWFNRVVGAVFISFGAALLTVRRSAT